MAKALSTHVLVITVCLAGTVAGAGKGITNTSKSPHVKLRSVDIDSVRWTDGFWADKFKWCHEIVIPNMWRLLQDQEISHAYDNFLVAAGLKQGRRKGPKLRQQTDYPWDGTIRIAVENAPQKELSLFLRIPGWAEGARVTVNGKPVGHDLESEQYFEIKRRWSAGNRIELVLPMPVQLLEARPLVEEARNQAAVRRGPIVYCLESVDLPNDVAIEDVTISASTKFLNQFTTELLGGITVLEGKARVFAGGKWGKTLYRRISPQEPKEINVCLIPYYAWGNRGDSEMTVWMPLRTMHEIDY